MDNYYGKDRPIDMYFKINKIGDFKITSATEVMSTKSDLTIEQWVTLADGTKELAISVDA